MKILSVGLYAALVFVMVGASKESNSDAKIWMV